ncbi:SDR family NAD(P)-dependent oxidoreductase [Halobaculum sp. MBLA0147]|uniref:SDR family NAD(P)-dependent oxidoreductase n=1 Tax=Halobaculum sp. MBLA0147 TaxID=3079934 RepID=UPI00352631B8
MTRWTAADVPPLDGAVVVVTGANSGLGYEGTAVFADAGATVVMACRSTERGERAAREIAADHADVRVVDGETSTAGDRTDEVSDGASSDESTTDHAAGGRLDVRECDLASLDSVAAFAEAVRADYDGVDVLCNNAGLMAIPRRETEDGFEMQLGVNHFGHFALTARLFPALVAAGEADGGVGPAGVGDGPARVVTQSSGAHEQGQMDFEDLHWERGDYSKWGAYGRSKLANLLFAYELDRRLSDADLPVRSVACHPGYAATNLQLRTGEASRIPGAKLGMKLANAVLGQDAATGALPMVYAAVADVAGGAYVGPDGFANMRGYPTVQQSNAASRDETDARRLWEISLEATGVSFPFDEVAVAGAE